MDSDVSSEGSENEYNSSFEDSYEGSYDSDYFPFDEDLIIEQPNKEPTTKILEEFSSLTIGTNYKTKEQKEKKKKEYAWTCVVCTFLNMDAMSFSCSMCSSTRPIGCEAVLVTIEEDKDMKECVICLEDVSISRMYRIDGCKHEFCFDCMNSYLGTEIMGGGIRNGRIVTVSKAKSTFSDSSKGLNILRIDSKEVIGIKCPAPKCMQILDYSEIRNCVDGRIFSKFDEFIFNKTIDKMPECKWCRIPGCGNIAVLTQHDIFKCLDPICEGTICGKCEEGEGHGGISCEVFQKWKKDNEEADSKFDSMIKRNNAKRCPKCKLIIIKDGGCDHMYCNNCKLSFNWSEAHKPVAPASGKK